MIDPVEHIDTHGQNILLTLERTFESEKNEEKRNELWKYMNRIKTLAIDALKVIPGGEKYISTWRMRLNFRTAEGYISQEIDE